MQGQQQNDRQILTRRQAVNILRDGPIPARRVLREAYRMQGAPNGDSVGGFVAFMVEAANAEDVMAQ